VTEEEHQALLAIQATFPDLDRWRARSRKAEVPERASELETDAGVWKWFPPAEVARQSLVAASQHLNLARTAIKAEDIYPTSHYTVLRGALVGGAVAVWVLSPDASHDRQQRGLRVAHEWVHRALQYNDDYVSMSDPAAPEIQQLKDAGNHVRQRRDEIRALWAAGTDLSAKQALVVTDVVDAAAASVFDLQTAAETKLLWRLMSGDAHALGWPILARASDMQPVGGGLGEFRAGGDLVGLAHAFDKCHRLVRAGWSLFDRRCESP